VLGQVQKFLTWVGSAIFGFGVGLENFPQKSQIFHFFPFQLKKYLGQRRVSLLFTAGQTYAQVRSGSISKSK